MNVKDIKPRPNHQRYLDILRRMSPAERLQKAWELTENARMLFREGLRHRSPGISEEELQELYLRELRKCHNNGC